MPPDSIRGRLAIVTLRIGSEPTESFDLTTNLVPGRKWAGGRLAERSNAAVLKLIVGDGVPVLDGGGQPVFFTAAVSITNVSCPRLSSASRPACPERGALTAVCDGKWVEMPTHLEK